MGRSWTGIDFDAVEAIAEAKELTPPDRWVLVVIAGLVDYQTHRVETTMAKLAERTGYSDRHLRPKITKLKGAGLITCKFPRGHIGWVKVECYSTIAFERSSQRSKGQKRITVATDPEGGYGYAS